MANIGVRGRITDEHAAGIDGLTVIAYDIDFLGGERRLASTNTAPSGNFAVTYDREAYGHEANPDIRVRAFDFVGRLLFESVKYLNVSDTIHEVGTIIVPSDVLRGYRVTLRRGFHAVSPPPPATDPYPLLSLDNFATFLIDNETAWANFTQDVNNSTQFVNIVQLWFPISRFVSEFGSPAPPLGKLTKLGDTLLQKNRSDEVGVRVLLNDVMGVPVFADSMKEVRDYLNRERKKATHNVEARGFPRPFNAPLHSKIAVVDGKKAYLIGSPFIQGYYDGQSHKVDEARRGVCSFWEHTDCSPLHDVSVSLEGPAVEALNGIFLRLWNRVGAAAPAASYTPPATANTAVQIVRTLPANLFSRSPEGETGILEGYLRAVREADKFIYLDNQYVTEPSIADALVSALKNNADLQVIMVVNPRVDIPGYDKLQLDLLNGMQAALDPAARSRLGLFTLWSHDTNFDPQRIIRIYTHAKVGVADDKWTAIGSANLDGVSLKMSQMSIPLITPLDKREARAIEINALFFDGVEGLPASTFPADLRRALWAEHLGYEDPDHQDLQTPPEGGWLDLWKSRAQAKLNGLKATPLTGHSSRVLEWRPERDPTTHLLALGLTGANLRNLKVEPKGRSYNFETGQWNAANSSEMPPMPS